MNFLINLGLIIAAAVFQVSVLSFLSIKTGAANMILIIFIILLFLRYYKISFFWALMGGFWLDFLSYGRPAGFTLIFLGIFFGLKYFLKIFDFREFLALLMIIFGVTILSDFLQLGFLFIIGNKIMLTGFWKLLLFNALMNLILVCLLYPVVIYGDKKWYTKKQDYLTF